MEVMEAKVDDIIEVYADLAQIPSVDYARLQIIPEKDLIKIHSTWSVLDLVQAESTKFTQEFILQTNSQKCSLLSKGIPLESSMSLCAFTKSRDRFAVIKNSKKNDESVFLEIWNLSQKEKTFDMSERKEHGKIHDNGEFKSFEWSSNGKYLLYIAEAKQKKSESFFKDLFCQNLSKEKTEQKSDETSKGEENLYQETWGECHTTAHHSVLVIFEVETGKIEVLNIDDKFPGSTFPTTIAQATWGPEDKHIVFVGYKETPSRLGVLYCSNRRSAIYSYDLKSKAVVCLTSDENICVDHPVFSPNFEYFIFLQNETGGPHKSCRKLMKCDWKNKKISTAIDIVNTANAPDFAGVYFTSISSRWWSNDSRFFFFHASRRSFLELFYIDILSSKVRKINIDKAYGSCVLHDVKSPYLLVSVSSPNKTPQLMIGQFTNSDDEIEVKWSLVDEDSNCSLNDLKWNVKILEPTLTNEKYSDVDFDILTVSSIEDSNGTLIVFPHGGPHSNFVATFYSYVAAFARLGYIVCMVNYRGSIGFGENSILSLLGNIGTQDVSDVMQAIEQIKRDENYSIKQVVGFGGSHGGFLIAHLLGQYPYLFEAAVIRNPVIDLSSMVDVSDIPDWCWVESGCCEKYDPLKIKTPAILDEMWKKSPVKYLKHVRSPTLLCLGKNDLRVPPSQGLMFHRQLRAQGVPSKVYYYDDNHALSKVAVTSDVFVHTALWFQSHLSS